MKKKRTRRKELRPGELVEAALAEFATKGYDRATVEAIAARAGAAKGTLYSYFPSKAALFQAAIRQQIGPVFDQLDEVARLWPGSSEELLRAILGRFYSELITREDRRVILRILISEGPQFPELTAFYYEHIISGARALLRRVLQQGVERGEFRGGPVLEEPLVVVGPATMAALWQLTFDHVAPLDLERFSAAHIDLVLHGLRASPGAPRS